MTEVLCPAEQLDVLEAVQKARFGQQRMAELSGDDRLKLFERLHDIIAGHKSQFVQMLIVEGRKLPEDASHEVDATLERLKLTVQEARSMFGTFIPAGWTRDTRNRSAIVMRVPRGIVAVISPFNYPLFIPAAKAIPALLAGNAVVLKPASATPGPMLLFAQAVHMAGFPTGAFSVVTGKGSDVGKALVENPYVAMVAFTGSTEVGCEITRDAGIKKLQLELGGKGIAIVLEDADLVLAAKKIAEGALKNAGQRCDAVSLVLAVESIADVLVGYLQRELKEWPAGESQLPMVGKAQPMVKVGPLISEAAALRAMKLIGDALDFGADLVVGGLRIGASVVVPTLLDKVSLRARIFKEETFGPVIPVMRVQDEEEALEIHGISMYGLDSSIFTRDLQRALTLAKKMQTGSVTINDFPRHGLGLFPYGGTKSSGLGREGIGFTLDEMTELKTIVLSE